MHYRSTPSFTNRLSKIEVGAIVSYHILSYHVISCHIMPYKLMSYHIILYDIIHIISVISYHVISCHIISRQITSYQVISYHIISFHSQHIISCHTYKTSLRLIRRLRVRGLRGDVKIAEFAADTLQLVYFSPFCSNVGHEIIDSKMYQPSKHKHTKAFMYFS